MNEPRIPPFWAGTFAVGAAVCFIIGLMGIVFFTIPGYLPGIVGIGFMVAGIGFATVPLGVNKLLWYMDYKSTTPESQEAQRNQAA